MPIRMQNYWIVRSVMGVFWFFVKQRYEITLYLALPFVRFVMCLIKKRTIRLSDK